MAGGTSVFRRELNIWEAVGISVALMAPSMAANINPQGVIGSVGRAVPLTFALATVGVLLVSYTFVRLTQKYHHSGSVYGFVGATLGARTGVVAGWGLLGTYTFYAVVTSTAAGRFLTSFLDGLGIWNDPPQWAPFLFALLALLGVYALTVSPVRRGTRFLLTVEGLTVLLILVVSVIILAKLAARQRAERQGRHVHPVLGPARHADVSALFLGVVFGFLSFAGFEAAATLGEEARQPRRDIPRAILGTAIFGGLYFIFVTWVEVMGFGTDKAGQQAFAASGSLLGDLGGQYVGSWVGHLISLGAAVSAFGCALACAVGASRLLFALGRDGVVPAGLGRVREPNRTPAAAARVVVGSAAALVVILGIAYRHDESPSFSVFANSGVIGTLILLVAYVLATIGAMRLLFFSGDTTTRRWEIVIPVLALVVLGYTIYRNVVPYPTGEAGWNPADLRGLAAARGRAGAGPAGDRAPGRRAADRRPGPGADPGARVTTTADPVPGGRPGDPEHAIEQAAELAAAGVAGRGAVLGRHRRDQPGQDGPGDRAGAGRDLGRRDVAGVRHVPRRRLDRGDRRARRPGRRPAALPGPGPAGPAGRPARLGLGAGGPDHPGRRGPPGLHPHAAAAPGRRRPRPTGLTVRAGVEIEFALGAAPAATGASCPACRGPAYGMTRLVEQSDFSADLLRGAGAPQGVEVDQFHPEYAAGQYEVSVGAARPGRRRRPQRAGPADDPGGGAAARAAGLVRAGGARRRRRQRRPPAPLGLAGRRATCTPAATGRLGMTAEAEAFAGRHRSTQLPALAALLGAPSPSSYLRLQPVALGRRVRRPGATRTARPALRVVTGIGRAPGPGREPRGEVRRPGRQPVPGLGRGAGRRAGRAAARAAAAGRRSAATRPASTPAELAERGIAPAAGVAGRRDGRVREVRPAARGARRRARRRGARRPARRAGPGRAS